MNPIRIVATKKKDGWTARVCIGESIGHGIGSTYDEAITAANANAVMMTNESKPTRIVATKKKDGWTARVSIGESIGHGVGSTHHEAITAANANAIVMASRSILERQILGDLRHAPRF